MIFNRKAKQREAILIDLIRRIENLESAYLSIIQLLQSRVIVPKKPTTGSQGELTLKVLARDGKEFHHTEQLAKYNRWLDDKDGAPGGPSHEAAFREHGPASRVIIEREGMGRTRVTSKHGDGFEFTQVHPETFRAHDIAKELLGIQPPPSIQTHGRARSHPVGPKEEDRVRREDSRSEEADAEKGE